MPAALHDISFQALEGVTTSEPPPVSGYTTWLDATQLSSLTLVDERVSAWNDLSAGGANDATQSTAAQRPYVTRYLQNSRSGVLRFADASNVPLLDSAETMSDLTSSFFIVAQAFTLGANQTLLGSIASTGGLQIRLSTTGQLEVLKQGVAQIGISAFTVTEDQAFAASVRLSGSDCKLRINQSEETDAHAQTLDAGKTMRLWANSGGSETFAGVFHEVIVYGSQLSDADDDLVMAYLKRKWGTP